MKIKLFLISFVTLLLLPVSGAMAANCTSGLSVTCFDPAQTEVSKRCIMPFPPTPDQSSCTPYGPTYQAICSASMPAVCNTNPDIVGSGACCITLGGGGATCQDDISNCNGPGQQTVMKSCPQVPACQTGIMASTTAPQTTQISDDLKSKMITELPKDLLKISIPGLDFSKINSVDSQGYLYIPWIAEYISAIYKFGIGIVSIIAVVMIIVQGVRIITSAGGEAQKDAYNKILQAFVGLAIAWGSFFILSTVNPDLVQFKALKVQVVQPLVLENLVFISDGDYQKVTGQTKLPQGSILQKAIAVTKQVGLDDPCYMITIIGKESGGNPAAIGHDENYPKITALVWSRRDFLLSGKKYSCVKTGVCNSTNTFAPPASSKSDFSKTMNNTKDSNGNLIKNDDKFDPNAPPDYGLDWRFSHGFGLGQATLRGDSYCGGQRGISKFGQCFTIPQLLTVDAAAIFSANLFKSNLDCAVKKGYTDGDKKIQAAFWAYAAGCGNVRANSGQDISQAAGVPRAWAAFQSCKAQQSKQFDTPDAETVAPADETQSQ
ncbi:MAG: pilin [Patescibacteria group bacterium]